MRSRRVVALAGLIVLGLTAPTMAQVPMMGNLPGFDDAPPAPPPGAGGAPMAMPPQGGMTPRPGAPPQAGGEPPPCFRDFMPLRQEAQKRGGLIKAAMERKAPRTEFCKLLKSFAVAEAKVVNYVAENQSSCGIPKEIVTQMKSNHERTIKSRDNACASGPIGGAPGGAPGGPPPGPRLSDELGVGRVGGTGTPGRGTFDTLTGNPLAR